jgi:trimeric autotransporter adhesin
VRSPAFTGLSIAGLTFVLAATSPSATNANPRVLRMPVLRTYRLAAPQLQFHRLTAGNPATCSADYQDPNDESDDPNGYNYFIGVYDTTKLNIAGGVASGILAGAANVVCDAGDGVGSGSANGIGNAGNAVDAFIGAGIYNGITANYAFIGSGNENTVSGNGSFIGAGGTISGVTPENLISGPDSFIGAGDQNTIKATEAFIGSGGINTINAAASYATILGGNRNSVSGEYASILGGFGNAANGSYAIVAGGDGDSAAGTLSFAAGYHADAAHNGSFVWSDFVSGSSALKDTAPNQFVVRASGGIYVSSNEAVTAGVALTPGSGTWASLSDRNAKTDVVPLDDASILAKVAALPIDAWRYKSESGVRHLGPMAQDFYAAFGVGVDDRHITSIDEDGVALASIKALHGENQQLRRENGNLRGDMGALRAEVRNLEAAVASIRRH